MNFLNFGGFIARLLGVDNTQSSEYMNTIPKRHSYAPIRAQVSLNRTVDRINKKIQRLEIHEKRVYKLKRISSRIERIESYMTTYDFKQLNIDYPGTEQDLLNEIRDLRYEARLLLNH